MLERGSFFMLLWGLGYTDNHAAPGKRAAVWSDMAKPLPHVPKADKSDIELHARGISHLAFLKQNSLPTYTPRSCCLVSKEKGISYTSPQTGSHHRTRGLCAPLREGLLHKNYLKRSTYIQRRVRHIVSLQTKSLKRNIAGLAGFV